jgi:hypothetical protein
VMVGRRRGGNRSLGHELAQQQVPQSDHGWGGAAGPASQRLQDQQPHALGAHQPRRAWRSCSVATATPPTSWKGARRRACIRRWPPRWSTVSSRSARSGRGAADREGRPAPLADDRPAQPQGLDRSAEGGRARPRGLLAGAPDPDGGCRDQPRASEMLEDWLRSYGRRNCSTKRGG